MRSGIGPEPELRRVGVPVVAPLPVGERLLDHCGSGLAWQPTERFHAETAAHERSGSLFEAHAVLKAASTSCKPGSFDLHLLSWTNMTSTPGRYSAAVAVFLMKPLSSGRVTLRSADPRALPLIKRGFLEQPEDMQPLLEGFELARTLATTAPLDRLLAAEIRPGAADLATYLRENIRNYFHPAGTCGMGRVVDSCGHVFDIERLVVADASIMPTIPRANTNLTTVALAERIAEQL